MPKKPTNPCVACPNKETNCETLLYEDGTRLCKWVPKTGRCTLSRRYIMNGDKVERRQTERKPNKGNAMGSSKSVSVSDKDYQLPSPTRSPRSSSSSRSSKRSSTSSTRSSRSTRSSSSKKSDSEDEDSCHLPPNPVLPLGERYPTTKKEEDKLKAELVCFFKFSFLKLKSLSNMWEEDVVIKHKGSSRMYQTGEHCFHGEKFFRLADACRDPLRKQQLHTYAETFVKPSRYSSPFDSKKAGGKNGDVKLGREEMALWDQQLACSVQKQICMYKIKTNSVVKQDLCSTGDKVLVHMSKGAKDDSIWDAKVSFRNGNLEVVGQNKLGRMWTLMRSRLCK